MSLDWYQDVLDFHRKFRPNMIGERPGEPNHGTTELRIRIMKEEFEETVEAMLLGDLPGVADGLADLIYVAIGAAVSYGIDLQPVWDAVHAANMAKVGGGSRSDGKVMKPPGWTPPDIARIISHQQVCPRFRLAPITATQPIAAAAVADSPTD